MLLIGGLMTRSWLLMRDIGLPPRATADIDLGLNRQGLRLSDRSRRIASLLSHHGYDPRGGEEAFRFVKHFDGQPLYVDLLVPKGASRHEPPLLERDMSTVAAPGLAYAFTRGVHFASAIFVDDAASRTMELPLPTLDAAFVLKAALVSSGVRKRPDRQRRDRVDAVMLAAACAHDPAAIAALRAPGNREAEQALRWLATAVDSPGSAVARAVAEHLEREHAVPNGGDWAVDVSRAIRSEVGQG